MRVASVSQPTPHVLSSNVNDPHVDSVQSLGHARPDRLSAGERPIFSESQPLITENDRRRSVPLTAREKRDKEDSDSHHPKYYKQRTSLDQRQREVKDIQEKFPGKVMIILERYKKERQLQCLDRIKFLVPREITLSQFVTIIRNRMQLARSQAIYFLIDDRAIASMTVTMAELHAQYRDKEDGFLYMKYASQETFG